MNNRVDCVRSASAGQTARGARYRLCHMAEQAVERAIGSRNQVGSIRPIFTVDSST